ncbi:MAG: cytochrome b/b6 domain-containing protein [Gallionella sp.]|nr:cytochrome B [Gallionella sp.]
MKQKILIWDVPTRVFHWLLVVSFAGAYYTADSERYRDIHVMLGYVLLGLIAFRLSWGFLGTHYAKFSSFLFKPSEVVTYLTSLNKLDAKQYLGHNPAGSVAIWMLVSLGLISSVTGVLAFQDMGGDVVVEWHDWVSEAMLVIVVLHVLGVLVSSVMHRENLVRSMVTGYKFGAQEQGITYAYTWLGVAIVVATITFCLVY